MPISNSARGRKNWRTLLPLHNLTGREFPVFEESPAPARHRYISMWVEIVDQIYCTFNMVGENPAKLLTLAAAVFTAGAEGKKKPVDVKILISGFSQFIYGILPKSRSKCVCEIIPR